MRKGQASLVSHSILIAVSVALVLIVVLTFNNIRQDYREFTALNQIEQTCSLIRSSIERVYSESDYPPSTETVHGQLTLSLPEKIADLNYRTSFSDRTIVVETLTTPKFSATCRIGFDVNYSGSTTGGSTEIRFVRAANNATIFMEKV